jgi:hypothetical protein
MSISNENRKNKDKEAKVKDTSITESNNDAAEEFKTDSSNRLSVESTNRIQDAKHNQRDAYNTIFDESEGNIERATEEAKNQIPKFTETVNAYQHETLRSARDIANNQINTQREIVNSLQNSWFPYWERTYAMFSENG